jgi:Glycosyl hydrolase family 31 C-terminal domain
MPPQTLAAVATLLSFAPHGNRVELQLDRGAAEIAWLTPSSFRFRRTLEGPLPRVDSTEQAPLRINIEEMPGRLILRSPLIEVSVQKSGVLLRVRRVDGAPLLTDLSEPRASAAGVTWERQALAGAQFYGLGPRLDPVLDLRGKALTAEHPFLICTTGYGEYHAAPGSYRFDFTSPDRYTIRAPAVDYSFYYGPTAKQIFEEHREIASASGSWTVPADRFGSWNSLRNMLLRLVHGSMSAMLAPVLSLRAYEGATEELRTRARQLGSLVDDVSPGPLGLSGFRRQLETFFATYATEAHLKGFPLWHPLPFQFPDDPECARHADEFMLGDEMLVAPIYTPGGKRSVYLPQGVWTNLETNEALLGRRTITVETGALPVFARNGAIVPLNSEGGMALHYFPKLAAEFFLLESDPADWTQVHAAPAGDIIRLQIEAKKARDYQWVVHHIDRPAGVGFEGRTFREAASAAALANDAWFYDAAQRNLQIRLHVAAGEDSIVNVRFP